ncbi:putative Serine/threonine-protein kinase EDR1 [Paratrimastix pyriformis]|uniref:Serine/threonine-protein kinase EDR1 n=1 Tax=Paratrimastix pyriformis TaxID=342808 RepID=A0ABQ8UIH4_9EUKA|nr:putative Serine/threonine-protein kinase EDR1 [Paratrimastix pyriformis]
MMAGRWAVWVSLCLVTLFSAKALGVPTPCYVSNTGTDHPNCTQLNAPCQTPSFAISAEHCQSVVFLTDLSIYESIVIPADIPDFSLSGGPSGHSLTCNESATAFSALVATLDDQSQMTSLTLANLTFVGCRAPTSGGALRLSTTSTTTLDVLVEGCAFERCQAACSGGALDLYAGPAAARLRLVVTGATFAGGRILTSATCPPERRVGGAAIALTTNTSASVQLTATACVFRDHVGLGASAVRTAGPVDLTLSGSAFINNQATPCVAQAEGGAGTVVAEGPKRVAVHGCRFQTSVVLDAPGAADSAQGPIGAALLVTGTTFAMDGPLVEIAGCTFNESSVISTSRIVGGAVYLALGAGRANISETSILWSHLEAYGSLASAAALHVEAATIGLQGLQVVGSTIEASGFVSGGAVCLVYTEQLEVDRCVIRDSMALVAGGVINGGAMAVLAIPQGSTAPARITNSLFEDNEALGGSILGGALFTDAARLLIADTVFRANSGTGAAFASGGAAALSRADGLAILRASFVNNSLEAPTAVGGALHSSAAANLTIVDSWFVGNSLFVDGFGKGGAVHLISYVNASRMVMGGCYLINNFIDCLECASQGEAMVIMGAKNALLEGVVFFTTRPPAPYTTGGCLSLQTSDVEMRGTTFTGCRAQDGGALALSVQSRALLTDCAMTRCSATSQGGAVRADSPLTLVGTSCEQCSALLGGCISASSSLTVNRSVLTGNEALLAGGAIFMQNAALVVDGSTLRENAVPQGNGAAIAAYRGSLDLSRSTVAGNVAYNGAVYGVNVALVSADTTYEGNAAYMGAAISLTGGSLRSAGDLIRQHTAEGALYGACFLTNVEPAIFTAGTLAGNTADSGGALVAIGSSVSFDETQLTDNRAVGNRGGAMAVVRSRVTMTGCSALGNSAWTDGGVLYATQDSTVSISGSTFTFNMAQGSGGALGLLGRVQWRLADCLFDRNDALLSGGALYASPPIGPPADLPCLRSGFTQNTATQMGAALCLSIASASGSALSGAAPPRLLVSDSWFEGQGSPDPALTPNGTLSIACSACDILDAAEVHLARTNFTGNVGGGLYAYRNVRAEADAGCVFQENPARRSGAGRMKSAWLEANCTLALGDDGPSNDTAVAGGTAWIYTDPTSAVARPRALPLLPQLHGLPVGEDGRLGAAVRLARPVWEVSITLRDAHALANFAPVCRFLVGGAPACGGPVPFFISRTDNTTGTCALADPAQEAADLVYEVQLSNDGIEFVSIGRVTTYRSYTGVVAAVGITLGVVAALGVLAFGVFFLARWVRLKRATAIELASWRSYQVASVDFTSLKILQRVGHGAAGEVFKGDLNGTAVAVKRLFDTSPSQAMTDDFRREVAMMRTLRHPYIVSLIGATFESPRLIITEFMGRGSLYGLLHDEALAMPPALRLRMAFDMARGLNYLHTLKPPILHRDVKSQNMLVTDDLRVKVSDFGISRLSQEAGITTAAGTPAWSAPEVLRGDRSWLPSDVFSFGVRGCCPALAAPPCVAPPSPGPILFSGRLIRTHLLFLPRAVCAQVVLWELFTRQTPWEGVPPLRVMMTVTQGARLPVPPPPAAAGEPGCPPLVGDLIRACFEERPEARPTMQQVVDQLAPEVEAHPYAAEAPAGERRRRRKSPVPQVTAGPGRRADSVALLEEGLLEQQ